MRSALATSTTNIARDNCPHCDRPVTSENSSMKNREDGIIVFTLSCPGCRRVTHRHFYRNPMTGQLIPMTPEEIARDAEEPGNRIRLLNAEIAKQQLVLDELRGQLRDVIDELDEQARAELHADLHGEQGAMAPVFDLPIEPLTPVNAYLDNGKDFDASDFIPSGSLDQELASPPTNICKLCGRANCMAVTMNDHTACDFHGGHA